MTREALLSRAWGYEYIGESRTVDVHVAWLREKLKGARLQIQAVRGLGYKLVAPPSPPRARPARRAPGRRRGGAVPPRWRSQAAPGAPRGLCGASHPAPGLLRRWWSW